MCWFSQFLPYHFELCVPEICHNEYCKNNNQEIFCHCKHTWDGARIAGRRTINYLLWLENGSFPLLYIDNFHMLRIFSFMLFYSFPFVAGTDYHSPSVFKAIEIVILLFGSQKFK